MANAAKTRTPMPPRMQPKTDLGRRFLAFVEGRHGTLAAAAEATGLSYQVLYEIASGRKTPRVDTLEKIVARLGGTMLEFYSVPPPRKKKGI